MKEYSKNQMSIKNTKEMDYMLNYLSAKWLLNRTAVMRHALAIAYELEIKKEQGD